MTAAQAVEALRTEVERLRARLEAEERQRLALTGRAIDLLARVEAMESRLDDDLEARMDDAVDRGFAEFAARIAGSMRDEVTTQRLVFVTPDGVERVRLDGDGFTIAEKAPLSKDGELGPRRRGAGSDRG